MSKKPSLAKTAQKCSGGNTKQTPEHSPFFDPKKRTRWIPSFTFFPENENKDIRPVFDETQCKYLCYGWETCPTTGKKHWQGCAYFYQPKLYKNAQKCLKIGSAHLENIPRHDNMQKAREYTKKEGDFYEFGIFPEQGARIDLDNIRDEIINGKKLDDIVLERPIMYHQYGRTLEKIQSIVNRKKYRTWMTTGIWYYGKTGVGKSIKAFEEYNPETHYQKNLQEDFWDDYNEHEIVILNEFRGQIKFDELLDLTDMHPKFVKIKGKPSVPFLAKKIIVTSSLHPEEIYKNSLSVNDKMEQFYRRFEVIELKPKEEENIDYIIEEI